MRNNLFQWLIIITMLCATACESVPRDENTNIEDDMAGIMGLPTLIDVGYVSTPTKVHYIKIGLGDKKGNDNREGLELKSFRLGIYMHTYRGGVYQRQWCEENSELVDNVKSLMFEHNAEKIAYNYEEREKNELIRRYGEEDLVLFGTVPTIVQFYYCQIEELVVTADQTLWGIEPGGNLIDKFKLVKTRPNLLISYEDYSLLANTYPNDDSVDYMPYLSKSIIPANMYFEMKEPFEERPERVWFKLSVRFKDFDIPDTRGEGCYFKYD